MSQDGSNPDKKSAQPGRGIPKALIGASAAIVAALIVGGPVLLSHEAAGSTNLAAFTTSSQPTASPNSSSPAPASSSTGSASISNEPPCASGTLQLLGSSAFAPIAQKAAYYYMGYCTHASITVNIVNGAAVKNADSAWGVSQVCGAVNDGSTSAGSIIAMNDGIYEGLSSWCPGVTSHPIGALIFSVVGNTNRYSDGATIATALLRDIFSMPGVKGYVAVGRQGGSGTRKAFIMDVLDPNPKTQLPYGVNCPASIPSSLTNCTEDSTQDELKFVNGTPNAIGYAESFLINKTDYPNVSSLSIDGVPPQWTNVPKPYKFWVVEHLYAAMPRTLTPLASDFLDWLPSYIHSHVPRDDFIVCADALKGLEDDCYPATLTSQHPRPHNKSWLSAVHILLIGSLLTLVCGGIWLFRFAFDWRSLPRVAKRPLWAWLGWVLALAAAVCASLWSAHFLGNEGLASVGGFLGAIGSGLFVLWCQQTSKINTRVSNGPDITTTAVMPPPTSSLQPAVTGPTPEISQEGAGPVPFAVGSANQPVLEPKPRKSEDTESRQYQPTASAGRSAFISYSHDDDRFRQQLEKSLAPLRHEKLISAWHDRRILPGQEWDREIDKNLENADVVLLLVSPDFLASEYAYGREMSRAMERHESRSATVIPIILRPSDWQSGPLGTLEALPSKGRPVSRWTHRDDAWLDVAKGLRRLISGQG